MDANGDCCEADESLDVQGLCCVSSRIDACGSCNGPARFLDSEGTGCATVKDASGKCCTSGNLDECGVRLTAEFIYIIYLKVSAMHTALTMN